MVSLCLCTDSVLTSVSYFDIHCESAALILKCAGTRILGAAEERLN